MKCVQSSFTSPCSDDDHMPAARRREARSETKLAFTSAYWILMTTCRPSSSSARWTCPIDAAPTGLKSIERNIWCHGRPSPRSMRRRISAAGLGGMPFCSTLSSSRYGSGAIGAIETAWPSLT